MTLTIPTFCKSIRRFEDLVELLCHRKLLNSMYYASIAMTEYKLAHILTLYIQNIVKTT